MTTTDSPVLIQMLFPKAENATFNWDHYLTKHLPLGWEIYAKYGVRNVKVVQPNDDSEYMACSQMEFPSLEQWEAAQKDPRIMDLVQDAVNIATVRPTVVISKIRYDVRNVESRG